jgi:tripartite-type tricarboxylate transporter receptor subunit TctC
VCSSVWGVVVPARTSASIIDRLNASLRKSLAFVDTKERFTALGIDVQASSPDEFRKFMAAEHARYARMAKEVGLKAD